MSSQGNDYIFGIRPIMEAIHSGKPIEKILLKKESSGELYKELFALIRDKEIPFQMVPHERLQRVTKNNHQGAIAYVSPIDFANFEMLVAEKMNEDGAMPLFLLLDRITDVRNFGAIARSAEIAGVDAIIIPEAGSARINGEAVKTSAGALHTLPICKVKHLKDAVFTLQQYGVQCVAASEKAKIFYYEADFKMPLGIVMGSEDKGVTPGILKVVEQQVAIPQKGKIQSLNVSSAAAVLLFEVVRQRG
ncbi:23S rRNA (guanosine(2251)-2'-O)-methyltransferase RlmB [Halosquirtibacter xylanolyticus]|uniref:23S rRNA (guanosine(2251)-2'-O)-methyltransferase RlmB n=1 Tax=Halosquirtibacter xylanolyticus TaxID=3374599 RepID=UPI00374A4A71|nr:23S rRNA (guanosine(2251)-2'-O)-methyltransferase RlmB [Prolixibacteraceae bacterium]